MVASEECLSETVGCICLRARLCILQRVCLFEAPTPDALSVSKDESNHEP